MGLITGSTERMSNEKLRRQIAFEAARLMYARTESEYYTAKRKAAKQVCRGGVKPEDLPSNAEIREQIQCFARLHEGDRRTENLRDMRIEAVRFLRMLQGFKPRLIGSVMTGHVRKGSDIDIHIFSDSVALVADVLSGEGLQYDVERKQVLKHGEERVFTHIHVHGRFDVEITCYAADKAHYVFKSSITGKAIERCSLKELEKFMAEEYPDLDLEDAVFQSSEAPDPWPMYRLLLLPLENVKQNAKYHPEGDVLYHSLQVFELAREERPYDEEFLTAALLHDVGKGLDPGDHVGAGLAALDGLITDRTRFLIEHHMHAHQYRARTLPGRFKKQLEESDDLDDLLLLSKLDESGRVSGAIVGTVDEALDYLKELARENGS